MKILTISPKNFKGRHFDADIILLCVRWYMRYKLSYRHLVEMMDERGVFLAHTTILWWVQRYIPEFEKRWRKTHRYVGNSWAIEETYLKVKGQWKYLYRAVDQHGNTVDFLLSAKRDQTVATRFLRKTIVSWRRSAKLTLDQYQPNHLVIQEIKNTQNLTRRLQVRTAKCLTNRIEQDHRRVKQRVRVMQTFQVFRNAQITLAGIELVHQFRKEKRNRPARSGDRDVSKNCSMALLAVNE